MSVTELFGHSAVGSLPKVDECSQWQIPRGWAVDKGGVETQTPSEVVPEGGLLPLGGSEASGGYKGYGLAMLVSSFGTDPGRGLHLDPGCFTV